MASPGRMLNVLVVDDSALVREGMQQLLAAEGSFSVVTAADPLIAGRKMAAARPDVILLDLAMPHMDGLSFLRQVMAEDPIPIVICSAMADGAADMALRALEEGAIDLVTKPKVGVRGFLEESVTLLVDTLRAAAEATPPRRRALGTARAPKRIAPSTRPASAAETVVAIGASTGGTEALAVILGALPKEVPGLVIVQHMPEGFTRAFAQRLDRGCQIAVREAVDGDRIEPGLALVCPGNRHMVVRRDGRLCVRLGDGALVSRHRPSVDVLFHSVAATLGSAAVGVLLTGMGRDGAEGLHAMRRRGAWTMAQDEETSIVFGMPKEAIALGAADQVLPLPRMAQGIIDRVGRPMTVPSTSKRTEAQ